jgi:chromosome segregation ATPase
MRKKIGIILVITVCFAGCGRVSEETVKEVLDKDPSFRRVLNAKRDISEKINALKVNFTKERDATLQELRSLKEELKKKESDLATRIMSLTQEIEPKILALRAKLNEKNTEYKLKAKDLGASRAKLKNMKKLLEKKGELSLSGDEITVWNNRIENLEKEIVSLQGDIDKVRSEISVLKTEIKILKQ